MSEAAVENEPRKNVPVTVDVHRKLLTIQYQRKMAGQPASFSEIIAELLAGQPVQP